MYMCCYVLRYVYRDLFALWALSFELCQIVNIIDYWVIDIEIEIEIECDPRTEAVATNHSALRLRGFS